MRPLRLPISLSHLARPFPRLYSTTTTTTTTTASTTPTLLKITNLPAPHTGTIRIIALNSPRNRNAISWQLLRELAREVNILRDAGDEGPMQKEGGVRALVVASELDEVFCAGADLKERRGMGADEITHFLSTLRTTLTTLSTLPLPTLTALSAPALGGGLELALATTLRVFSTTATVGLPETRLGIIPGAGGTYRLKRLVGESRAMDMILTGRRVGGREAGAMGLCSKRVVEVQGGLGEARREVLEEAVRVARGICEGGPGAVGCALRAVRGGSEEVENREYEVCLRGGEREEALRAFAEKRRPEWGRVGGGAGAGGGGDGVVRTVGVGGKYGV